MSISQKSIKGSNNSSFPRILSNDNKSAYFKEIGNGINILINGTILQHLIERLKIGNDSYLNSNIQIMWFAKLLIYTCIYVSLYSTDLNFFSDLCFQGKSKGSMCQ